MDAKTAQFIHEAEKVVPPEHSKFAGKAAIWIADNLGHDKCHLALVSSLAASYSGAATANEPVGKNTPLPLADTPQETIMCQMIADWAEPWAQKIRTDLFKSPEVPFSQEGEASQWIEREAGRKKLSKKWRKRVSALVRRFADESARMAKEGMPPILNLDVGVLDLLPYPAAESGKPRILSVPASFNPLLYKLATETKEMAERTGWQQAQAVMYVLSGAVPPTPLVRPRLREMQSVTPVDHNPLRRRWLEMQIAGSEFSEREWVRIYRQLLQGGIVRKKKALRDKNAKVYTFLKKNRPPLTWKQALEKWNKAYPKERYHSIRGLQKAYDRAFKKGSG